MGTTPPKGPADFLDLGTWNFRCFRCGRKIKANEARKNWQGFYTCDPCYEPRQPQDFVRGVQEKTAAEFVNNPADDFQEFCTPNGTSAVPARAEPGCAIPGYLSPAYNPDSDI